MLGELAGMARAMVTGRWTEDDLQAREMLTLGAPRALLVLEPARWISDLSPRWIALEQVPAVLPIWEAIADGLRTLGYSTWTGLLNAERYGVPQTRTRAILIASLDRDVGEPPATHQRYIAPKKDRADIDLLFGEETPDRGRIEHPADRHLLPWVSMAEALGWDEGPQPAPAPTVSAGGTGAGGGVEVFAGKDARARVQSAVKLRGTQNNGHTGELGERHIDEPAFTVATNADRWHFVQSNQTNATCRDLDQPAPTIMFGNRANEVVWQPTHYDQRQTGAVPRSIDEPAPTMLAAACDDRVSQPGHKGDGVDAPRQKEGAVRVTQQQAAVLQSFPADYAWRGTKSKQFQQIGNAVPPGLAEPVLREVLGL